MAGGASTRLRWQSDRRLATFAYIDEFQDYLHLPVGVEAMLTQARGLGLGLTLAHQHLGQLPAAVREAVLANARSRIIFQVAASDAQALARELTPDVKAADLQNLGRFEVVARLSAGGLVTRPVTGTNNARSRFDGTGRRRPAAVPRSLRHEPRRGRSSYPSPIHGPGRRTARASGAIVSGGSVRGSGRASKRAAFGQVRTGLRPELCKDSCSAVGDEIMIRYATSQRLQQLTYGAGGTRLADHLDIGASPRRDGCADRSTALRRGHAADGS